MAKLGRAQQNGGLSDIKVFKKAGLRIREYKIQTYIAYREWSSVYAVTDKA
jgi:hypothetical protein